MGELSAETLKNKGVLGYVVDGGCRDTDLFWSSGFRCSTLSSRRLTIVARWVPDHYGAPVPIGTVTIRTGDYILGDRDGLIVIPHELAAGGDHQGRGGGAHRKQGARRDSWWHGPVNAYLKYGKF